MTTTTLKSGHVLAMTLAPFSVGNKLKKVVMSELAMVHVDIDKLDLNMDLSKLDPKALNTLKNIVCRLLSSDTVEQSFFECAGRCTIDSQRITRDTFEPEDMRGDFLPCAWEVIRFNLAPFFESLDLSFLTKSGPKTEGQK